jgi:hypothetical protein
MERFCPSCGTAAESAARYCGNCGTELPAAAADRVAPAPTAAAGESAIPTPAGDPTVSEPEPPATVPLTTAATSPVATAPLPVVGAQPPVITPVPAGAGVVVAPARPVTVSGRVMAALVGALAVVGVIAAIFFFVHGRGSPTSAAPVPQPTQPQSQPQPRHAPPSGSWPRNQIADSVGSFRLVSVTRDPGMISGSVTDAYVARYKTAGGVTVTFILEALKSQSAARNDAQAFASFLIQKKRFVRAEPDFTVKTRSGKVLGIGSHLVKGSEEAVVWSDESLSLLTDGPKPYSVNFYIASDI